MIDRRGFVGHLLLGIASLCLWRKKTPAKAIEGPYWRLMPNGTFYPIHSRDTSAHDVVLAAVDGEFRLLHFVSDERSHPADKDCLSVYGCQNDPPMISTRTCGPVVRSAEIHVGVLQEPLKHGGVATVYCPNPYYKDCNTHYSVHAGTLVARAGWPAGHPVAFTSINGRFETIGW